MYGAWPTERFPSCPTIPSHATAPCGEHNNTESVTPSQGHAIIGRPISGSKAEGFLTSAAWGLGRPTHTPASSVERMPMEVNWR
jgi:hypothetical protein